MRQTIFLTETRRSTVKLQIYVISDEIETSHFKYHYGNNENFQEDNERRVQFLIPLDLFQLFIMNI